MDKKELFNSWAPQIAHVWAKFAKPALFVHTENVRVMPTAAASPPSALRQHNGGDTAIIVDLPGDAGIKEGLGLATAGFRPVPLYNGIHEPKNGGLRHAVDNSPIINALAGSANTIKSYAHSGKGAPAFLLDANRDNPPADGSYDNRWSVDLDDMPDAAYLRAQGIGRVIIWTNGAVKSDISRIISNYSSAGIDIMTFTDGQLALWNSGASDEAAVDQETKEAIRKFENARFALLIAIGIALFNLIGMFAVNTEPFFWTAPSIMWITYLWVAEVAGDIIAIAMTLTYFMLFWFSQRKRILLPVAAAILSFDVLVYYIYVFYYGIAAFTGHSIMYGLIAFMLPAIIIVFMLRGAGAYKKTQLVNDDDYFIYLDHIDGDTSGQLGRGFRGRRARFRYFRGANYRGGYRGYGGTGRGGYGSGYGGYGGFGG